MTNLPQDLRHSLRRLGKNPGLTVVILLTLAFGIGANTAIFTVDYASMIAPIPYPIPDQLVIVWSKVKGNYRGTSPAANAHIRQAAKKENPRLRVAVLQQRGASA